jgi:NAD(P)-dependent dehydrogenase (short-subunit alcohol dehydrogenase family)
MEWFRLDGQNAFVTGAGSGIGQGIAIGLAQTLRVSICLLVDGGFVCW